MPSHYGSNSDTHKMPDGTVMSGKTHSKSSRVVKKKSPKKEDDFIGELKEGSLKRMLKMGKKSPPLKIGELQKLLKIKDGSSFMFRDNEIKKLTPLMRKRINTAITLIRINKKSRSSKN